MATPEKPETSLMSMVCGLGYSGVKCTRHFPPPSTCTWLGTWNRRNKITYVAVPYGVRKNLTRKIDLYIWWYFLSVVQIMQNIGLHLSTGAVFRIRIRNSSDFPDPDLLSFVRIHWSRSFSRYAKKIRKNLLPPVLWHLNNLLSLKAEINIFTVHIKQKKIFLHLERVPYWRKE